MFKFTRHRTLLTLIVVITTVALDGCGQTGPLYRRDQAAQAGQPNSSPVKRKKSPFDRAPAPQAQKGSTSPAPETKGDGSTPNVDPDRPTPTPTP